MSKFKVRFLVHPVLFALLPIASLLGTNVESVAMRHAVRPAIFAALGAVLLFIILWKVLGDWGRAGIVASAAILFLLTYGYIQDIILDPFSRSRSLTVGRHLVPILAGIAALSLLTYLLSKTRINLVKINDLLVVVAVGAMAIPLIQVVEHEVRGIHAWPKSVEFPKAEERSLEPSAPLPDIYYIVLDGYGRADVLSEFYGLDNSQFVKFLGERGFFVGERSSSNYGVTHMSIASSLNMSYLDDLGEAMGDRSTDQRPITTLLQKNRVLETVRDLGYKVYAIESGYRRTELRNADILLKMQPKSATPFEAVLIEHSLLRALLDLAGGITDTRWYPGHQAHRQLIRYSFDQLFSAAELEGPKFVFAHIISPHPPFVFDSDGGNAAPNHTYSIDDGSEFAGSRDEYISGYRDQVAFLNSELTAVINNLNDESAVRPIIVLQSDHGPGLMLDWDDPEGTDLYERMSILNAISLPGMDRDKLPEELSPVNTFRLIFNELFGTDYALLEDMSYFSSWRWPYDFVRNSSAE